MNKVEVEVEAVKHAPNRGISIQVHMHVDMWSGDPNQCEWN